MDRQDLNGKLTLVRDVADAVRNAAGADLPAQLDAALVGHPELVLRIRDADGRTLFVRGVLPDDGREGAALAADASARQWLQWWQVGDRPLRGLSAPLNDPPSNTSTGTVLLGMDISHHQAFMIGFRHLLVLSIIIAASTAAVLGWIATRAGLRPLRRITALASELSTERLDARLPESGVPAEINVLVDAFNAMLARLDDSFRRLSEFSADVAHELRTPIANLTLQTQVALQGSRDPAAYRELLYSSLEEYERLGHMIGAMLYLAQADQGLLRPTVEEVDLREQVEAGGPTARVGGVWQRGRCCGSTRPGLGVAAQAMQQDTRCASAATMPRRGRDRGALIPDPLTPLRRPPMRLVAAGRTPAL